MRPPKVVWSGQQIFKKIVANEDEESSSSISSDDSSEKSANENDASIGEEDNY